MRTPEEVFTIANDARQHFEANDIARPLLEYLCLRYQSFDAVNDWLDFLEPRFPQANCLVASVYLKHLLGGGNIIDGSYAEQSHQFLEIEGLIVDTTADQFDGGPDIYVGPLVRPWDTYSSASYR